MSAPHYQCLQAVKNSIVALGLSGIASASIVVQKVPIDRRLVKSNELAAMVDRVVKPAILICPTKERGPTQVWSNLRDLITYGVLVVFYADDAQDTTLSANLNSYLDWRYQVRSALSNGRLDGTVPTLNNVTVDFADLPNVDGWSNNRFITALQLWCDSLEARASVASLILAQAGAWWKFGDDGQGPRRDSTDNQNDLYLADPLNGVISTVAGKVGNAASFNASTYYIADANSTINWVAEGGFMGWFKPAINQFGLIEWGDDPTTSGYQVNTQAGQLFFKGGHPTLPWQASAPAVLANGSWYHVAVNYLGTGTGNSGKVQVYINGVQQTLSFTGTVQSAIVAPPDAFWIGNDQDNFASGLVDDFVLSLRRFSAAQIAVHYNGGNGLVF